MELCETTGKRCYSKKDAQSEVNAASRRHWANQAKHIPKRVYLCPFCKAYHLTKQEAMYGRHEKRKKNERRHTDERRRIKRMEESIFRYSREY